MISYAVIFLSVIIAFSSLLQQKHYLQVYPDMKILFDKDGLEFFTLVIASHEKRADLLEDMLKYLEKSRSEHQFETVIVWGSDKDKMIPINKYKYPIRVFYPERRSIASRFLPDIFTRCFFSLDDDIRVEPFYVDKGFSVWKEHPDQIVGYNPRNYIIKNSTARYIITKPEEPYRIMLIGMGFFDQLYAREIYTEKYSENLELCYKVNNCEDLLFNFIVAKMTKKPTILVSAKFIFLPHKVGLSKSTDHIRKREMCLVKLENDFGDILVASEQVF